MSDINLDLTAVIFGLTIVLGLNRLRITYPAGAFVKVEPPRLPAIRCTDGLRVYRATLISYKFKDCHWRC